MANLGNIYCKLKQYDKAIKYDEKALKIRLKLFGEQHADTADVNKFNY